LHINTTVAAALTIHLRARPECLDYYLCEDLLLNFHEERLIVAGTLDVENKGPACWRLKGLCPNGEVDYFGRYATRHEAITVGQQILQANIVERGYMDERLYFHQGTWA